MIVFLLAAKTHVSRPAMKIICQIILFAGLGACSAASAEQYKNDRGVTYSVMRFGSFAPKDLPSNSDLTMADGDLVKFAAELCGLNGPYNDFPDQCDLYVQPSNDGTLIGYATLVRTGSTPLLTTVTKTREAGKGCAVSGRPTVYIDDKWQSADIDAKFEGRIVYSAWEKNPGDWVISDVGDDGEGFENGSTGVWYIKKDGDKLRITQERWSYCYSDDAVYVDDVFRQVVSMKKMAH